MSSIVVWVVVALAVAVVVVLVAGAVAGEGGPRGLLRDLRQGLRSDSRRQLFSGMREEADDEDAGTSVDELFTVGRTDGSAYLDPTRWTAPIERLAATRRPVGTVPQQPDPVAEGPDVQQGATTQGGQDTR